ncbi:MAG TPA: nucleotidyltransferase family protein [Candidatus Latescibacteria bacterium]|nr:nucleotidyltransferase family protein [Candidatus Latescibacterota bacterium]HOS65363.1 nucleotidyltransferase family protein [Candidatus Latescibacterota bacterium]HOT37067.1 nucleotidyltransferase family protein [Candidatus Latescibacterota bacterium]HRU23012.1 nucleotidyltransferase family protein [Candidatus Latescibacterota bacterium]
MRPTSDLLRKERAAILQIARRYGARNLRVFGSVARGEDTEMSDIDILVDFAPDVSLFDHAALMEELESALGRKVDVVSEHGLRPRMRERVLKEAVPL